MWVVHNTRIYFAELKRLLLARRYLREVEKLTGLKVHPKQLKKIKEALKSKKYTALTKEATNKHRKKFKKIKKRLIKEWEQHTGQKWPKHQQKVYDKKGEVFKDIGDDYDAHHIIENNYGGDNAWWNIHPARNPDQHQAGIHGKDALSKLLFGE